MLVQTQFMNQALAEEQTVRETAANPETCMRTQSYPSGDKFLFESHGIMKQGEIDSMHRKSTEGHDHLQTHYSSSSHE